MTSSPPERSLLPVLETVVADASPRQLHDEVRSNGVVDTPARANGMTTKDQPSSSRPSRKAKEKARNNLWAHAFAETLGEPERRRIQKNAIPEKIKAASAMRKGARRGQERKKVTAATLENIEKISKPYRAEEPVSERAEVKAADIPAKRPESIPKVTVVESDFPEPQVPVVHCQHKTKSSKSAENATVKPASPDKQVPIVDDQQQYTRYELSLAVTVPATAVDDEQQNQRSTSSEDAAVEAGSLGVQVPAVDNRQQDQSRESAEDDAAKPCHLNAAVPNMNDQRQDESPQSTKDAAMKSFSPGCALADVGMFAQTPKRFFCTTRPLQSMSDNALQQHSTSSIRSNSEEGNSLRPCPQQRQGTPLKIAVSKDYVYMEHIETKESKSAARKMSVRKEPRSSDQAPQLLPPPVDQYYVEETAWRKFNPPPPAEGEDIPGAVASEHLQPLPPAPPIPELPHTGKCTWSFDEHSRVLLAEFVQEDGRVKPVYEDEEFLLRMMERDDITVISDGLATGLDPDKWTLEYIANAVGDEYYHKFRAFQKELVKPELVKPETARKKRRRAPSAGVAEHDGNQNAESVASGLVKECPADRPAINGLCAEANESKQANGSASIVKEVSKRFHIVKYLELDQCMSMKVYDFVRYMGMRKALLRRIQDAQPLSVDSEAGSFSEEETIFKFFDHMGLERTVDLTGVVLYMIDFDVVKLLPKLYEEFMKKFELSGCLPGGIHCMMNSVNINGRPFMGPNLYCTPPGSFTQCHQDGHGTVDSGHLCLAGFNEVVMIRRLPQRHKLHALALLKGEDVRLRYDGLYDLPHGDGLGEKPDWPCLDAIENCRRMNYYPSVFILRPGQLVHINKGRLHMFRKLSPSPLPTTDCHANLRKQLLESSNFENPDSFFCFSIAWDWMYRGVTIEGIYREVMATLECTILNRLHSRESLAIPELSLLQMARTLTPVENVQPLNASSLLGFPVNQSKVESLRFMPSSEDILRGILPALRYVVDKHTTAVGRAVSRKKTRASNEPRVSLSQRPNTHENPQAFALDPYGSGDFFCKLCSKELSNVYMHCDGCEILLSKDFNICVECWESQRFKNFIQMHPLNGKRHSTINHTGNFHQNRASRCPCKNGPICLHCNFCAGCSCKCHQWFTLHWRFFTGEDEMSLVRRVEAVVGENQIPYSDEVFHRLEAAAKPVASSSRDQAAARGTKRQAMEHYESSSSKKRQDDRTKNDGPVAPRTSSCCRDQASDPPIPSPEEATRQDDRTNNDGPVAPRTSSCCRDQASDPPIPSPEEATRQDDRTNNDGPVAPRTSSHCRDKASDPPIPSPEEATPKSVKKIAAKNTVPHIPADSDTVVVDFDAGDRPDELRPTVCAATAPVSRDDLSDGALAFTEPKGNFRSPSRSGSISSLTNEQVRDFVQEARALDVRTPSSIRKILPDTCELTEDGARHLFRNFADCKEIGVKRSGKWEATVYSRRELDILLFGHFKNLKLKVCHALMPYRDYKCLEVIFRGRNVWSKDFPHCEPYIQHLENTVGLILSLETPHHGRSDEVDMTGVFDDQMSEELDMTEI